MPAPLNVTLIRIDAQDASGAPVAVRLASHDMPEACHLGGEQWEPALSTLPDFALDFFGGAFSGQITAPRTSFAAATTGLAAFGPVSGARARFADARVRIWFGDITSAASGDLGPLALLFDGRLTGEPLVDDATRTARFDAAVQDSWADKPLLASFAGSDGIEGPADLTGQTKPLVLGNARFVGGMLIDRVDNVWMVSNGPVQAVNAAYDRLASLGTSAGDFANLAALKAATIPNGSWGTCLAQGLVRFGAPPDGRVCFDVSGSNIGTGGYVRRAGALIRRIAELAGGTVNAASLAALDAARPYNLQLQLGEQTTAREAIARIADSVGAVAGVGLLGQLFAQPLAISGEGGRLLIESGGVLLLENDGDTLLEGSASADFSGDDTGALRVASVEELAKAAPVWRLATEAELTFQVHSVDEAAFAYRWQGEYSASRVYRIDDVVTGPDGAAWVYIGATPSAGQALPVFPATDNAYWVIFQRSAAALPSGLLADRPASGSFVGQQYATTDTGEVFRWSGTAWVSISDVTSTAQREIISEFALVEIRQFEAGNVGNRTVGHYAKRGAVAIGGGTWSLVSVLLGDGSATINSSTGLVTLSGIVQSGTYRVRYVHTDGVPTERSVNVNFMPQASGTRTISASPPVVTWFESSTSSRTVSHVASDSGTALSGGTWSLVSVSSAITASINAGSGVVTISAASDDGTYKIRYTHTDTVQTEKTVNLDFYPAGSPGNPTDPNWNIP